MAVEGTLKFQKLIRNLQQRKPSEKTGKNPSTQNIYPVAFLINTTQDFSEAVKQTMSNKCRYLSCELPAVYCEAKKKWKPHVSVGYNNGASLMQHRTFL